MRPHEGVCLVQYRQTWQSHKQTCNKSMIWFICGFISCRMPRRSCSTNCLHNSTRVLWRPACVVTGPMSAFLLSALVSLSPPAADRSLICLHLHVCGLFFNNIMAFHTFVSSKSLFTLAWCFSSMQLLIAICCFLVGFFSNKLTAFHTFFAQKK